MNVDNLAQQIIEAGDGWRETRTELAKAVLERGQRIAELEAQLSSCMHEQQRVKAEISGYVEDVRRAEAQLDPQALTISYAQGFHDRDDEVAGLRVEVERLRAITEKLAALGDGHGSYSTGRDYAGLVEEARVLLGKEVANA